MILKALPIILLSACSTLPTQDDARIQHVALGTYEVVCMTVEVTPPEQIGKRCNFGLAPQGREILGCTFPNARPHPLLIVPMLDDANDWPAQCVWGHEFLHGMFGDWHAQPFKTSERRKQVN